MLVQAAPTNGSRVTSKAGLFSVAIFAQISALLAPSTPSTADERARAWATINLSYFSLLKPSSSPSNPLLSVGYLILLVNDVLLPTVGPLYGAFSQNWSEALIRATIFLYRSKRYSSSCLCLDASADTVSQVPLISSSAQQLLCVRS